MSTRVKAAAGFFLRLALLYVLLISAWPVLHGAYSATFRGGCRVLPGEVGDLGRVTLLDREASETGLDVSFSIGRNDVPVTKTRQMGSFFVGYLPTAFLIALVLSTPISWARRGRTLPVALLLLHLFIGFKVVYSVYSLFVTDDTVALVDVGYLPTTVVLYVNTLLNESTLTIFSVPIIIWIVTSFRREDFSMLSDRFPWERAPRFQPALAIAWLCVIVVVGVLTLVGMRDWQTSVWSSAAGMAPRTPQAHTKAAAALSEQGRFEESIQESRKALQLDPLFAPAHSRLGEALFRQGQLEQAARAYGEAIRLEPDSHLTHHKLGVTLAKQGELQAAMLALKESIRLAPEFPAAHHWLGTTLGKQGDVDGSVHHLTRAVELAPDDPRIHCDLGMSLTGQGRFDRALTHLETALRLDPDSALAHLHTGRVLEHQGRGDRALDHYRDAVRLDGQIEGQDTIAAVARKRIDEILQDGEGSRVR